VHEDTVIAFLLAIFLSASIALNKDNFVTFIYNPFFETLYNFASFIARISAGDTYNGGGGVESMFASIYDSSSKLVKILDDMSERIDVSLFSILKVVGLMLTIFIIKFLFLFLVALFVIKFTVTIFSAHIIMIIMPITLSLFPFKSLRPYSFNHLKSLFQYGLTIIFYCIAISISIYLIEQIRETADEIGNAEEITISFQFLLSAIITAGMGYIMLVSSNEFASKILNVAGNANVLANKAMNRMATIASIGATATGAGVLANYAHNKIGQGSDGQQNTSTNTNGSKQSSITEFQKHWNRDLSGGKSQSPNANMNNQKVQS
jgi:hypothetical protein